MIEPERTRRYKLDGAAQRPSLAGG